jgi:hypothetical protein
VAIKKVMIDDINQTITTESHNLTLKYNTTGISIAIINTLGIIRLKISKCTRKIPSVPFVIFFTNSPEFECEWYSIESFCTYL